MSGKTGKKAGRRPSCTAVIAAAGSSERMAGGDKLFAEINGAPVLAHTIAVFQRNTLIDEIVVVTRQDSVQRIGEMCTKCNFDKVTKVMVGGDTRQESVLIGALAASPSAVLVAVHDGARPCADDDIIREAIESAAERHAAAPAVQVTSTIKRAADGRVLETVDRTGLFEIQTPQVFTAELLKAALTNALNKSIPVTDDCMAAELLGIPVYLTEGSRYNIKITTQEDLFLAEAILASRPGEGAGI